MLRFWLAWVWPISVEQKRQMSIEKPQNEIVFVVRLTTNFDENQNLTNSHHYNHNWPFDETKCFRAIIYECGPNIGRYFFAHPTGMACTWTVNFCEREAFKWTTECNKIEDLTPLYRFAQHKRLFEEHPWRQRHQNFNEIFSSKKISFVSVARWKSWTQNWFIEIPWQQKKSFRSKSLFQHRCSFDTTAMFIQHYLNSTYQRCKWTIFRDFCATRAFTFSRFLSLKTLT